MNIKNIRHLALKENIVNNKFQSEQFLDYIDHVFFMSKDYSHTFIINIAALLKAASRVFCYLAMLVAFEIVPN